VCCSVLQCANDGLGSTGMGVSLRRGFLSVVVSVCAVYDSFYVCINLCTYIYIYISI